MSATPMQGAQVSKTGPREVLRLRDAVALIVGIVIGAGIFKAPSLVADMAGHTGWMFAAWALGGVASLIGALCYAELATAYPSVGGDYHFLGRAFGRSVSLLFGWARLSVITTGSIALLAFVFGDYVSAVLPLPGLDGLRGSAVYAAASILVFTHVNLRGIKAGTTTQVWLTGLEVLGLLLVVAGAFFAPEPGPAAAASAQGQGAPSLAMFGLAMVFVLLTYGGWNEAAYISAELLDKRRNTVRALVIAIVIITALYLAVAWAYWEGLGLQGMAKSQAIAADLLASAFGAPAQWFIAALVAVTALTSINATMIVGARTGYALGRDWPALGKLAHWDDARGTPANAFRVQCVAALLLVGIGAWFGSGFRTMVEFTAPVFWLFFLLSGLSLFVLRLRDPGRARPYRVPLYPLLPLLFCLMCAYMLWSSLSYVYSQSMGGFNAAWVSVAVLAAGGVLLLLLRAPARGASLPDGFERETGS